MDFAGVDEAEAEEVQAPQKLIAPPPEFPSARDVHAPVPTSGSIVIEAVIDLDGCVTEMEWDESSSLAFSESTKRSFRYWVFRPATLEERPVTVWYHLTSNFRRR